MSAMVPMPHRARSREWWAWLLTTLVLVLVFEWFPLADLWVSAQFHSGQGEFPLAGDRWVQVLYHGTPWLGRGLFLASIVLLAAACWPLGLSRAWQRRAGAMALVLLLGLGAVVHAALKESWGRPRPHQVMQFGGTQAFVPALRPIGACTRNCSFVSGHAATGFALLAFAMFGPRARRRRWFGCALAAGLLIGAGRIVQGGHFLSDILFAGVFMWATTILTREAWLRMTRWRRLRLRRDPVPELT